MMYVTYYETGKGRTKRFHKKEHRTAFAAKKAASALSERTGLLVAVLRNGIKIVTCKRGSCKIQRRR